MKNISPRKFKATIKKIDFHLQRISGESNKNVLKCRDILDLGVYWKHFKQSL